MTTEHKTKNNIAFKVLDEESNLPYTSALFEYASANNHPVEMGFYKGSPHLLLELQQKYQIKRPTLHTNHYKFDIGTMIEKPALKYQLLESLSADLDYAGKIGAKRVVIHPYKYPFPRKKSAQKRAIEAIVMELEGLSKLLHTRGITAHIENTFDEADFYLALFEVIKSKSISNFGFCFDMGHAKVWSTMSFDKWFKYVEQIDELGFDTHFHIHANNGTFDDHLPFLPPFLNSLHKDDEFVDDYHDALRKLFKRFGTSTFTAEVKPQHGIENMKVLSSLADD